MKLLIIILLEDYASVMSAEAERIAEGSAYGTLLRLVEGKVQVVVDVLVLVVLLVVDSRRNDVVLDSQYRHEGLNGTGSAEQVASHRLGRADIQLVSVLTEEFLYSLHL